MINFDFNKEQFELINIKPYNYKEFIDIYYPDIDDTFKDEYSNLLSFLKQLDNAIFIKDIYIKDMYKNKNVTTKVIKRLKQLNKTLILYSCSDSETYWSDTHNFRNIDDYVYIWN